MKSDKSYIFYIEQKKLPRKYVTILQIQSMYDIKKENHIYEF